MAFRPGAALEQLHSADYEQYRTRVAEYPNVAETAD